jgi:hypothetical protein
MRVRGTLNSSIAALFVVVLLATSACGVGRQVDTRMGDTSALAVDDGQSRVVSGPSGVVRVGMLPEPKLSAVNDFIAVQKTTLEQYAGKLPDLKVAAVITFTHPVDQATLNAVVSLAGLKLTSIEWQGPNGTSGVSSVLVDANLAAIQKHVEAGGPSANGPILAVAANGLASVKDLYAASRDPNVLLVDPGPLDSVQADASRGVTTQSQGARSFYWRYQQAASNKE